MGSLIRGLAAAALALAAAAPAATPQQASRVKVDVKLVLAVDVSRSMDQNELTLQRMGYVEAFRAKDVAQAVTSGPEGKIAVIYMEWGGDYQQRVLIPWTIIDSAKASTAFADRLANADVEGGERTSISMALYKAADLVDQADIVSHRKVIDVSGDGANNTGPPIEQARADVLKRGFTINGLPIMLEKPKQFYDIDHLDRYYRECVIGGPAAFIAPVFTLTQLAATVRKKLVLEIADAKPPNGGDRTTPPGIEFADARSRAASQSMRPLPVQLKLPTEKQDCFAGEKAVGRGYGGYRRYGGGG